MSSKRDREKLRSRLKARLDEQGRSQKDLEAAIGLSTGTLTRVFSGKKTLDVELLASLAGGLDVDPASLVDGTAWAELLGGATPESASAEDTEEAPPPVATPAVAAPEAPAAKPEPRKEPVRAEEPARPRSEPPPSEPPPSERTERRARKRDLPAKALRFLSELIFG